MAMGTDLFSGRIARALLSFNNVMILASSAILLGILSYYISWGYRSTHLIYNEVIVRLILV